MCKDCIDKLFNSYKNTYGTEEKALYYICMNLDIYFSKKIYSNIKNKSNFTISFYIQQTNLVQYKGKTFQHTIVEEIKEQEKKADEKAEAQAEVEALENIDPESIKFWGSGFGPDEYEMLENEYCDWTTRVECETKSMEELLKEICLHKLDIQKARRKNEPVDKMVKSLQDLLGNANLKPVQETGANSAEQATFGTLIRKWENEKPIPEPDPAWADVDGIKDYIEIWFLGHLCKMMGVKNSYSQKYEDEIAKHTVEAPVYEEDILDDSLEDAGNGGSNV